MKQTLQKKIENLFEPEIILEQFSFLQEKSEFKTEDQVQWLENISYFKTVNDFNALPDWSIYFSRLMPFFEFAMMFKDDHLFLSFFQGQCHDLTDSKIQVQLPQNHLFEVFKTEPQSFLKKVKISHLVNSEKWSCYFIRVTQNTCYILFTEKAEPWSKLLMESLQKSIVNYAV